MYEYLSSYNSFSDYYYNGSIASYYYFCKNTDSKCHLLFCIISRLAVPIHRHMDGVMHKRLDESASTGGDFLGYWDQTDWCTVTVLRITHVFATGSNVFWSCEITVFNYRETLTYLARIMQMIWCCLRRRDAVCSF